MRVSHNTERFVCNHLYCSNLKYVDQHQLDTICVFVYVPLLNQTNLELIVADFSLDPKKLVL